MKDDEPHAGDAAGAAYEDNYRLLRFIAYRFAIPPDDVRSVIHDVFVSYLAYQSTIREHRAWLIAAMSNACRDYRREKHVGRTEAVSEETSIVCGVSAAAQRLDAERFLTRATNDCRDLLWWKFFEGCSHEEIATRLATTVENARQRLHRCVGLARKHSQRKAGKQP